MVKKSVKQSRGLSLRENIWIKVGKQTTKKKWGNRASVGLPWWLSGKESICQCRRHKRCGFDPWVWKIPWRRKWQPTPVFLPGKCHGQRSLEGYSPWGSRVKHELVTEHEHKSLCEHKHSSSGLFSFIFFGCAQAMWDLGFPTRDQTHVPCSGLLDCHGIPQDCFFSPRNQLVPGN